LSAAGQYNLENMRKITYRGPVPPNVHDELRGRLGSAPQEVN